MVTREDEHARRAEIEYLSHCSELLDPEVDYSEGFAIIKKDYDERAKANKTQAADVGKQLNNAFVFAEQTFGEGQEMLIMVTEMTASPAISRYIATFGCEAYFRHNKELLFYERHLEVIQEIEQLDGLEE